MPRSFLVKTPKRKYDNYNCSGKNVRFAYVLLLCGNESNVYAFQGFLQNLCGMFHCSIRANT